MDVIVDLEDWEWQWVPTVPIGKMYLSFPMADEDEVDPKTRDVAHFIASLIGSGRTCSCIAPRDSTGRESSPREH